MQALMKRAGRRPCLEDEGGFSVVVSGTPQLQKVFKLFCQVGKVALHNRQITGRGRNCKHGSSLAAVQQLERPGLASPVVLQQVDALLGAIQWRAFLCTVNRETFALSSCILKQGNR